MFAVTVKKIIENTVALITQTVEIDLIQHGVRWESWGNLWACVNNCVTSVPGGSINVWEQPHFWHFCNLSLWLCNLNSVFCPKFCVHCFRSQKKPNSNWLHNAVPRASLECLFQAAKLVTVPPNTTPWFTSVLHLCCAFQLLFEQCWIPESRGSRGSLLADWVVGMQPAEPWNCVWRESCPTWLDSVQSASTGSSVLFLKANCDFTVLRVRISCWRFQN